MGAERGHRASSGVVAAALCLLTATAGLVPLAMTGRFRPAVGVPLVVVGAAALLWLWRPDRPVSADAGAPRWFLPAAMGIAVLVTIPSAMYANEHAVMDRDPGIYLDAAVWARTEGDLVIDGRPGPFSAEPGLVEWTDALPRLAGGDRGFQGLHLLPLQAAALGWIGGDNAMARAPALLAATGLVLLMAFARRVVGPGWALVAGATLGVTLPFAYLSRDFYSEWSLFALGAAGLWALDSALGDRSVRRGVVAGAVLGAATMARIDSPLMVGGLALALGWWWTAAGGEEGERVRDRTRVVAAVAGPMVVGWLLGLADGWLLSRGYLRAHRSEVLGQMAIPFAALALLAAVALARRRRRLPSPESRVRDRWRLGRSGALVAAGAFVALALFAVVVRPSFPSDARLDPSAVTAGLQRAEGEPVDPTRTYWELSGRWLVWYLGAGTVLAAVAGGAVLIHEWARGRRVRAEGLLVAVVGPPLVLFLARPSIYPDQPWASRRFLPAVLPGLVLTAAWFGRWLWSRRESPSVLITGVGPGPESGDQNGPEPVLITGVGPGPESGDQNGLGAGSRGARAWAARVGAVLVAVAMVGYPLWVLGPLVRMRQHTDNVGLVRELCAEVPGDAALLVVNMPAEAWVPTLRTFCDRPVAGVADPSGPDRATVTRLAREWEAEGRRLWLVGPSGSVLTPLGSRPAVSAARHDDLVLRWSLTERPHRTREGGVALVAGPVG